MDEITFFGRSDTEKDGHVSSEYPSWTMTAHVDELEESVSSKERTLKSGAVAPSELPYLRESLDRDRKRLDVIKSDRPKLPAEVENKVLGEYKKLRDEIGASLFSRSEMEKGLADPHKEAVRMVQPCIKVDPAIAAMCNVKVSRDGKVSRNDASKIFKIAGHYFGEETNIESLRKDEHRRR